MGIFVPQVITPAGFTLSNVYMSFYRQPMYIVPLGSNLCRVNATYKIWVNESKRPDSSMKFPLFINEVSADNLFTTLYTSLKALYPGAQDVGCDEPISNVNTSNITASIINTSNIMTSNITLDSTTSNITLDSTTSNINILDSTTSNITLDSTTSNINILDSTTSNIILDSSNSDITLDSTTSNIILDSTTSNITEL
jgi:hypothetical protein